jgi:hypothetical protein
MLCASAVVLNLAACSSDDDDDNGTTDTGATDTGTTDTGTTDTGTTDTGTTDTGSDTGTTDTGTPGETNIRVLHASSIADGASAAGVDIYTGDSRVVESLVYKAAAGPLAVPAGDYAFNVFAAGGDPMGTPALAIPSLAYAADSSYVLVAYDSGDAIAPLRVVDDTSTVGEGNIRVRAIHVANGVGQVDIWNVTDPANPSPLVENLDFAAQSNALEIPAQAYVIGIDVDNDATPDLTFNIPALPAGTIANVYAVADDSGVFLLGQLPGDTVVPIAANPVEEPLTQIRVLHASSIADGVSAPGVDIYTGDTRVVESLVYKAGTDTLAVPAGDYAFNVFGAGGDPSGTPALAIPSLSYEADASYVLVAYDTDAGIAPLRVTEDTSAVGAGNIRVRAIHVANGVGQVDIWNITDPANPAPLAEDLDFGAQTDAVEIPAQAYELGFDLDNDATPDATFSIPALPAGTIANVYAVADESGVFLLAQLAGDTVVAIPANPNQTNIRVFHGSGLANTATPTGVDIFTGDSRVVSELGFLESTGYLSVDEGPYSFNVFATGSGPTGTPALAIPLLPYLGNISYTLVAYDNAGSIAGLRLDDNTSAIAAGSIRLRAIHIAAGVGEVDIWNITDSANPSPLVVDLGFGSPSATLDVPAVAYRVGFDVNNDAVVDVSFSVPALDAGTNANVFAVKNAAGDLVLAAQIGDAVVVIPADPT